MHLRHLIVLIIDVRNWQELLYNSPTEVIGLERNFATHSRRGDLIGQIKKPEFTCCSVSRRGAPQTSRKASLNDVERSGRRSIRRCCDSQTCSLCATYCDC